MLEVALSRRMCCSRVCSASRYAGRPSASTETPTSRPGRCRSRPARDRHEAGVRAAVEQRDAEALRRADHDVGAELAGRLEQGEREQVGGDDGERAALVRGVDQRPRVEDPAGGAGVLHQHAGQRRPRAGRRRGRRRPPRCPSPRRGCGPPRWSAAARRRRPRTDRRRLRFARRTSVIASAAAVPSSSRLALAVGSPVRSPTTVWKLSSASSRPWEISGWYGV